MNVAIIAKVFVQFTLACAFCGDIKNIVATPIGRHIVLVYVDLQTPKSHAT